MPQSGITPAIFERMLGSDFPALKTLYANDFAASPDIGIARLFGDMRYLLSARMLARSMSTVGAKSWLYYVDLSPAQRAPGLPGTTHAYDQALLFNSDRNANPLTKKTGDRLRRYWVEFARQGKPDAKGLAAWPSCCQDEDRWLVFGERDEIRRGILKEKLDLLTDRHARRNVGVSAGAASDSREPAK